MTTTKVYISATLFNKLIRERQKGVYQSRLGLLVQNSKGLCIEWIPLPISEEHGCSVMPGVDAEDIIRAYVRISGRKANNQVLGYGYISSIAGPIPGQSDVGGDLWGTQQGIPFIQFTPTQTIGHVVKQRSGYESEIEVAVVQDDFDPKKKTKTATKVASKHKQTKQRGTHGTDR